MDELSGAGHNSITQVKLAEAKQHCQFFAMDFDGTLSDGQQHKTEDALALIQEILARGKTPGLITARAATALKIFVPPLEEYYRHHQDAVSTYIAGGNGTVLFCLNARGLEQIYNYGLSLDEVKMMVAKWQAYAEVNLQPKDLSEKGLATFKQFYSENWEQFIPMAVLNIGRPFSGRIFTEEAKVTFMFPKDVARQAEVVMDMQKLIGNDFSVTAGDKHFCHMTRRLHEDSKRLAVQAILQRLGLNENQVATFGDMPHGNDKGLLSFPVSFTNCEELSHTKNDPHVPPYLLLEPGVVPVARVYKAIRYILKK